MASWAAGRGIENYVASANIEARKPASGERSGFPVACCAPPPSARGALLKTTARRADRAHGHPVRDVLRRKGTPYDALGLDDPALTDDALIDA